MNITLREYTDFNLEEILSLYDSVGWSSYTDRPERLQRAFQHSLEVLAAYDRETGNLLGILRALGDGETVLFIQDILVFPQYQRQGVGTALVREVLRRRGDVYQIELATDREERTLEFYRSLGFTEFSEMGCAGFMKLNPL